MASDLRIATLIVNPAAGRVRLLEGQLFAMEQLMLRHGLALQLLRTSHEPDSAAQLARSVAAQSAMVIACGGDGTVHGVLQGLALSDTPLGVLPVGTANALARHLRLPLDPLRALERLLSATPKRVPIGRVETPSATRYFLTMAGCGPDGALVHRLSGERARRTKRRFGRASHYAQAARLFFSHTWPEFRVEYRIGETWHEATACAALASRLPDLGGLFTGLTRHADFLAPTLHLQVMGPPGHLSLAAWFTLSRLGVHHPWQRTVDVDEFRCGALSDASTLVQADAELLGPLPFAARMIPNALTLLMPDGNRLVE